jgi:hypothetical protein
MPDGPSLRAVKDNLATPLLNDEGVNGNTSSASGLLCSRNARPQKALVGRAQRETEQATLSREETSKLGKADSQ